MYVIQPNLTAYTYSGGPYDHIQGQCTNSACMAITVCVVGRDAHIQ